MNHQPDTADNAAALALLESRFPQTLVRLPDGTQMAVRTAGLAQDDLPTFVLLHGIGSGAASWLHVALRLAEQARVVAWDAPGYGQSTPVSPATPMADDYAQRLAALLDTMRIRRCILVGHSLGALTATAFAAGAGRSVVDRLVLISPARGYGGAGREAERRKVLEGRLRNLQERGIAGMAAESPQRMLSASADASARAWVRWNGARLDPAGYTQAVQMLCAEAIERHAPLGMPVDVMVGDADVVTPPDACAEVASRLGASFTLIPRAGHASPVEQAHAVADRLASPIEKSRRQKS